MDYHRVYDGALSPDLCQRIIAAFEKDKDGQIPGELMGAYNADFKNCAELHVPKRLRLSGPIGKMWAAIDSEIYNAVKASWEKFDKDTGVARFVNPGFLDSGYQIQRYEPNEGCFKPHIDSGSIGSSCRFVAAVIYLNTVEVGGGTKFIDQNETVDAVEGRVVWFPCGWTHPHEGLVPVSGRKYIITTFMCYEGYELLDPGSKRLANIGHQLK